MKIVINQCRNFEESQRFQRENGIFADNQQGILFKTPPCCIECKNNSVNSGMPCAVVIDSDRFKNGRYAGRKDIAVRRACKIVARKRRKENYKRNYAERQAALRYLRANLAKQLDNDLSRALDSISVTWETFGQAIATAARKVFGGMK